MTMQKQKTKKRLVKDFNKIANDISIKDKCILLGIALQNYDNLTEQDRFICELLIDNIQNYKFNKDLDILRQSI